VSRRRRPTPDQAAGGGELSLAVVAGRAEGETVVVGADPIVFGRAQTGPNALGGDPELSRAHARVSRFEGGGLLIEDLHSTNGTFVNGSQVSAPTVIRDGDVVWIGTTTLLARAPGEALPAVPPTEPPTPSSEAGFLSRVANAAIYKPKIVLGALVILLVVGFVFGGKVTSILRDNRGFDDPNSENSVIEPIIGKASGVWPGARTVALYTAPKGKTVDDASVQKDVARVLTFYETHDPFLVSRDHKSTEVAVFYKPLTQAEREDRAKALKDAYADPPKVLFGGQAIVNSELRNQVKKDLGKA